MVFVEISASFSASNAKGKNDEAKLQLNMCALKTCKPKYCK